MKRGMSLIEIMIALVILTAAILVVIGVMAQGLMSIKKGKNNAIASNLAIAQFEVYKDKFHMIPFHDGINIGGYKYPDRTNPADTNQTGKFIHHSVNPALLPGGPAGYYGADDFYHNATYDLNHDGYHNDIIEPLKPLDAEGVQFTPVVEIKSWSNGFNINEIKHMAVTVYWSETIAEGTAPVTKHVTFEGYLARTQADPW